MQSTINTPPVAALWIGRPTPGLHLRPSDAPITLFGLFFLGIASLFVAKSFPFGLLLPHFWVGVYFAFGRYFIEAKMRSSTEYTVTADRASIVCRWPTRKIRTVNLRAASELSVTPHRDGTTTITFGPETSFFSNGRNRPPAFEFIADGAAVADLIHSLQARPTAEPERHWR